MGKLIDMSKSLFELCNSEPEIISVMKELGFENITDPAMLSTVGRFMTIPKGAAMKNIDIDKIKSAFVNRGYTIID